MAKRAISKRLKAAEKILKTGMEHIEVKGDVSIALGSWRNLITWAKLVKDVGGYDDALAMNKAKDRGPAEEAGFMTVSPTWDMSAWTTQMFQWPGAHEWFLPLFAELISTLLDDGVLMAELNHVTWMKRIGDSFEGAFPGGIQPTLEDE